MNIVARLLAAFLLAVAIAPAVVGAASARSGGDVIIPLSQVATDDLYLAGNNVRVEGTVSGDVVTAARTVVITGRIDGDLWAVGETVEVRGTVTGTVRAAGRSVTVTGNVGGDVVVAAESVDVTGTVGRDVWSAGSTVRVAGTVGRDAKAAGDRVTLAGRIGGTVTAKVGDQLELQPGAAIGGNLTYTAPAAITPPAGVTVAGRTAFTERIEQSSNHGFFDRLQGNLYWLAASLILLVGILLYARKAAVLAAAQIRTRPGISFLAGLGFVLLTPLAIGFLLLSLVGIPLAGFTGAGYLLVIYTAKLFPALLIGGLILQRKSDGFWSALAAGSLGLVLYFLLNAVPVLGGLLAVATVCFGAGAQLLLALKVYGDNKKKYGV